MRRQRILISAYACEPGKGSEPADGWNWVEQMSRHYETWVLTRANNQPVIESAKVEWASRVHWIYFDFPAWSRFWKKWPGGVQLYYWLWQMGAFFSARKALRRCGFDLVHHATFGQFWVPSWMGALGIPFVFGPVGGGEDTPPGLLPSLTPRQRAYELLRSLVRNLCRFDPVFRRSARRTFFLLTTEETEARVVRWFRPVFHEVMPQFAMNRAELSRFGAFQQKTGGPFRMVTIGRLVHWKGCHLSIQAFARLLKKVPQAEYWIVSDGPERPRLEKLAADSGCAHQLKFWGRLPTLAEVYSKLEQSDILVHPALHEAFGNACLEALAAGRPVICLNRGGPALQVTPETGIEVEPGTEEETVERLAEAMTRLATNPDLVRQMGDQARKSVAAEFSWETMARRMDQIYQRACEETPRSQA